MQPGREFPGPSPFSDTDLLLSKHWALVSYGTIFRYVPSQRLHELFRRPSFFILMDDRNQDTVTLKGIAIGIFLAGFASWWAVYGEVIIQATPLANDHSARIAFFLFFVVVVFLNSILTRLNPKWRLGRGDLVTIFVLLLTSAAIPTRGFVSMLGPAVNGAEYYGNESNRWIEEIVPFVKSRKWLVPQGENVAARYFEGLREGESTPWAAWARPVASWLAMCLAFTFFSLCIAAILRKQWVVRERIIYPLMQLPIELATSGETETPIWKTQRLWVGFLIPCLLFTYQGLAHYNPDFISKIQLVYLFPIFNYESLLRVYFSPLAFALLYFVRMDMLAGLSIFPFVLSVSKGFMKSNGMYPSVPKLGIWSYDSVEAFFGAGILLVFAARIAYFARAHIWDVLRSALGIKEADDSDEIMSYRWAVFGFLVSGAFMVAWLHMAGMAVWQACLFLFLAFTIFLALARVIAESGLPVCLPPMVGGDIMVGLVGSNQFTVSNLSGLGFTYPFHAEMRCFVLSHAANGLKMADETLKGSKRRFLIGLLLAVTASFLVAILLTIYFPYRDGGLNLHRWTYENTAKYSWIDVSSRLFRSEGPVWEGYPLMLYGALLMGGLMLCAHWIPAWPINPGALVVSFHWAGQVLWSSAVFALFTKWLILKYGGVGVFRNSRPFFYGIILGEVVTTSLWVIVDGLTGTPNNYMSL